MYEGRAANFIKVCRGKIFIRCFCVLFLQVKTENAFLPLPKPVHIIVLRQIGNLHQRAAQNLTGAAGGGVLRIAGDVHVPQAVLPRQGKQQPAGPGGVPVPPVGVPVLLIPTGGSSLASRLKAFLNPMFVAMLIGVVLGLWNPPMPAFVGSVVDTLGDCMSPVAMLLTGMTIARIDLKTTFKNISVYIVSVIRLLVIPLAAVLVLTVLPVSHGLAVCIVCSLAMPLGLNTIVVPGAYGKDTSVAAGMALISHTLSCATIPLVFMVFDLLVK